MNLSNVKNLLGKFFKAPFFLILISVFLFFLVSHEYYFLIYVSFVPLFLAIYRKSLKETVSGAIFFSILMLVFFFEWMVGWSLNYQLYYFFIFSVMCISFFLIFLAAVNFSSKKTKTLFFVFSVPFFWILLQKIYSSFGAGLWAEPSLFSPVLAPLTWFVGSIGISFLIILFNICIAVLFIKKERKVLFLLLFLVVVLFSSYFYASAQAESGDTIKIALIQGNFPQPWGWRVDNVEEIISVYEELTLRAAQSKPDIIVWPEYAVIKDIGHDKKTYSKISRISKEANTTLIVGAIKYAENFSKYTNTAFIFSGEGKLIGNYDSVEPFLFDEYAVKSTEMASVFDAEGRRFKIIACNEETINGLRGLYLNNDGEFIVSIANNQGAGRGLEVLSLYSRLRASETRKSIARATNTGTTQIIDSYGRVVKRIKQEERNILIGEVHLNKYKTFYSKYGDIPLFVFIAVLLVFLIKRENEGKKEK